MPFLDHLEELRWRILYSLAAVLVCSVIGWLVVQHVDVIGLLKRPIAPLLPGGRLLFTSPTEPFFITLKFAFALGLLLASPVVIYEVWAFLAPALYDREQRLIVRASAVGVVLLYQISILCAWLVTRRRARRAARDAAGAAAVVLLLLVGAAGGLRAQQPVGPPSPRPDTTRRPPVAGQATPGVPGQPVKGQTLDTAAARKMGLPSGPTRTFPPSDSVMDALLRLKGYRITQYVADTLLVRGDSQVILLRGQAYVDREGTKVEADSIRYKEASCRLDAVGSPRLFDQGPVLVGEGMRYDTCIRRGVVNEASTRCPQGGCTWYS